MNSRSPILLQTFCAVTFATAALCPIVAGENRADLTPAADKSAKGAPAKSLCLVGRLEQLGGRGAGLPVELTIKGLKALNGQSDPSAMQPLLKAGASYPQSWTGRWGGFLRVDNLSASTMSVQEAFNFNVGETGVVVMTFLPGNAGVIILSPTDVFFTKRDMSIDRVSMSEETFEKAERMTNLNSKLKATPYLLIRNNLALRKVDGTEEKNITVLNTARLLSPGTIEQNIVGATRKTDPLTNRSVDTFQEVVIRLSMQKDKPNLLLCQVARAEYTNKGQPLTSALMQGWLTPQWRSCAAEIEKRSGWTLAKLGYTELVDNTQNRSVKQ